ncbi:hypothetical protein AB833_01705 [Chromatiales bacterium (ex Bugula neritina AB1)]|nr:hypothetical protein AB833_01705 [Chromatiales bacterium (ex Bugula neritina AB1)]
MTKEHTALVAGVTGAIGAAVAHELSQNQNRTVYGLSRNPPSSPLPEVSYLQTDLSNRQKCSKDIAALGNVTHIYYCGRATHSEQVLEDPEHNLELLRNLLDSTEKSGTLQHVHLVQGGKYYGVHIGPFPTPAQEGQPRAPAPNFNYDQQDFLSARSERANWTWSASRPNTLIHYSPAVARNLVSSLGAYAALCKAMGAALDFPGPAQAYNSITQVTSLDLLARGISWMSCTGHCANHAFNITNTDIFRWSSLWPKLADAFSMPVGTVRPMQLADVMADRQSLWMQLCRQSNLKQTRLNRIANWGYLDATLTRTWDEILCHNKTRAMGFHDWDNSEDRFFLILDQYRSDALIP